MAPRLNVQLSFLLLALSLSLALGCSDTTSSPADARADRSADTRAPDVFRRLDARPPDRGPDISPHTPCGSAPACVAIREVCVQTMSAANRYECLQAPKGCDKDHSCKCVGFDLCTGSYNQCEDPAGANNLVQCWCPSCR